MIDMGEMREYTDKKQSLTVEKSFSDNKATPWDYSQDRLIDNDYSINSHNLKGSIISKKGNKGGNGRLVFNNMTDIITNTLERKIWAGLVNHELLIVSKDESVMANTLLRTVADTLGCRVLKFTNDEEFLKFNVNELKESGDKFVVFGDRAKKIAEKLPNQCLGGVVIREDKEYIKFYRHV